MLNESTEEIDLILQLQKICESRLYMLKNIISDNEALEYVHSKNNDKYDRILNTYYSLININKINKELEDINIFITNIKKTLSCECRHNFVYDDIDITPSYSKVIHYCTICEIEYDDYQKQL